MENTFRKIIVTIEINERTNEFQETISGGPLLTRPKFLCPPMKHVRNHVTSHAQKWATLSQAINRCPCEVPLCVGNPQEHTSGVYQHTCCCLCHLCRYILMSLYGAYNILKRSICQRTSENLLPSEKKKVFPSSQVALQCLPCNLRRDLPPSRQGTLSEHESLLHVLRQCLGPMKNKYCVNLIHVSTIPTLLS